MQAAENPLQQALHYYRSGNLLAAESVLQVVIKQQPKNSDALHLLGIICALHEKRDEALRLFRKAVALDRTNPQIHANLGKALCETGSFLEAIQSFERTLALGMQSAEIFADLGNCLLKLGHIDEALARYEQALSLKPGLAVAWSNCGVLLDRRKQSDEALACHDRAVSLTPQEASVWCNRGTTLQTLQRHRDALDDYERAITLKPDYVEAWMNRGLALTALKQTEEALACFDRALAIDPGMLHALGYWFSARQALCDWRDLRTRVEELRERMRRGNYSVTPFVLLSMPVTAAEQRQCAEHYGATHYPYAITDQNRKKSKPSTRTGGTPEDVQRIRIAYCSSDFHEHPVGALIAALIEGHDRSRFEVFAISFGPDTQDPTRLRLRKAFDHFHDVRDQDDIAVATLIGDLGIDIAVNLNGLTLNERTGIFARRAAPIQVDYHGLHEHHGHAIHGLPHRRRSRHPRRTHAALCRTHSPSATHLPVQRY